MRILGIIIGIRRTKVRMARIFVDLMTLLVHGMGKYHREIFGVV